MNKPVGSEERAAWDAYAASALRGVPALVIHDHKEHDIPYRVSVIAELADAMLVERRKRMSTG